MDFIVDRKDFSQCKFINEDDTAVPSLEPEEVLLNVTEFAFTANNITYAVAGDMLSYWDFFPADEGWGRIPVWGIAVVAASNNDSVQEGERYFGYLPMSNTLKVIPHKVSPLGFSDSSPHRKALPPTYNQYSRMTPELGYDEKFDDHLMLFRPLFMTSFLIDDFLADNAFFGARNVVISSASSKTSFGLAFLISKRAVPGCEVFGLTSAGNKEFVEGLGCYDRVVTYDDITSLPSDVPTVFVDMAGNAKVITSVHHHFKERINYSCLVGITHWKENAPTSGLPGATPTFFFAPDCIQKRTKDWGSGGLQERFGSAWDSFMTPVADWINVVRGEGKEAVERVYSETLQGRAKPNEGHILSL